MAVRSKPIARKEICDGANVSENRTTPKDPEQLAGTIERVQQSGIERYVLLRHTSPTPGIASIGTYGTETSTTAGMSLYLYGYDAEQKAAPSELAWRRWFRENFERKS